MGERGSDTAGAEACVREASSALLSYHWRHVDPYGWFVREMNSRPEMYSRLVPDYSPAGRRGAMAAAPA
ncbi:hypothetical protein GCM10018773_32640 [Streptomyces candidus]|nr:hypothetical protein GCM10018773_32640 [Streptomyces candidus]